MAALGACADGAAPVGPARLAPYLQPSGDITSAVIPGEYIVVLDDRTPDVSGAASEAASHGAHVTERWSSALQGFAMRGDAEALRKVREDPRVKFVEPNQAVSLNVAAASWGLDRIDQVNMPLDLTYSAPNSGAGVHIYIIDTGIYLPHTEFTGRLGNGFDAITAGGNANDCHGHGTHVAGTAGGTVYGVAHKAILHPVRVFDCIGSGNDTQLITAINWVAANRILPAVANMSLGGSYSAALNQATTALVNAGVTTTVSAGNAKMDACSQSPSGATAAITVGAMNLMGNHAIFSNFGPCVDLYAPGVNIVSAWNWSATATAISTGTSMASPHVAGAAALYLSAYPAATPAVVGSALTSLAAVGKVGGVPANTPNKLLNVQQIVGGSPPPPPPPPPPPVNNAPVAAFTVTCVKASPSKCSLDANSSTDDGGKANLTFAWTNTAGRPAKTGLTASYVVAVSGYPNTFNVTLTATDAQGLKSAVTKLVVIP
ncbi:MAG: S8 family peptidase [Cytophagaceae bacterium]|nr:S8 family peptidase [Gemmatimonadaceae bacterium]